MELPHVGLRCEVSTCKQLDFLPIKCSDCGGSYCKDHSPPSLHACVGEDTRRRKKEEEEEEEEKSGGKGEALPVTRHPCQVEGCKGGELTPVICSKCERNFCLAHRHQADHSCPCLTTPDNSKEVTAAARIKAITDSMTNTSAGKKGQGRRSQHLANKVQLMKLKQKSTGEKGIPQEDRIYLLFLLPKSSSSSSMPVFISRHWSLGRTIDAIATLAKVKNNNNIVGAAKLRLFHPTTGASLGSLDQGLQGVLGEHSLQSGHTVILEYVEEGATHLPDPACYKG